MLSSTLPLQYQSTKVTKHTEISGLEEDHILFTVKPVDSDDCAFCLVNLNAFAHGIYLLCMLWKRPEDLARPGCSSKEGEYFLHRCTHTGIEFLGSHDGKRHCKPDSDACESVFDVFFPEEAKKSVRLLKETHVFGQGLVNLGEFGFILAQQPATTTENTKQEADDDDEPDANGEGTVFYLISQHRNLVWIPGAANMLD